MLLLAWALSSAMPAHAVELTLSRLADASAAPEAVIHGAMDARFVQVTAKPAAIHEKNKLPTWWRVQLQQDLAGIQSPMLVLDGVYLTQVETWLPGTTLPSEHAIYGAHADHSYATRALVIPLPSQLRKGDVVYLRVRSPASTPITVSIVPQDAVRLADLQYVAWRSMILTALILLAVLSLAFWAGIGEISFLYLAAMMIATACYMAGMGGEARGVSWLNAIFANSRQPTWFAACIGVAASCQFIRHYLDTRKRRWMDRVLKMLAGAMACIAILCLLSDADWIATSGNIGVICSALAVLCVSLMLAIGGNRQARFVLASWLPLLISAVVVALQMQGAISGPGWLRHALTGSQAMAGLLLMTGMADKLAKLRLDRDQASREANTDALTGLCSRKNVEDRLKVLLQSGAHADPLSLAYIDIDHFKSVNDTHGHHVGDSCLRFVVARIRNRLRVGDILGRYGGDELLLVMPDTSGDEAFAVAERMRDAVGSRPLSIDDITLFSTLSIGVAQWRIGESAQALMARADKALYASKASGRECVTLADACESLIGSASA